MYIVPCTMYIVATARATLYDVHVHRTTCVMSLCMFSMNFYVSIFSNDAYRPSQILNRREELPMSEREQGHVRTCAIRVLRALRVCSCVCTYIYARARVACTCA